jgi:hypothetical protein
MESIQQQITTLTQKVDRLYQVIDRLHTRISPTIEERPTTLDETVDGQRGRSTVGGHPSDRDDIQRLRQNGSKYQRNSGYADLPGGSSYRPDTSEWIVSQQDVLIDSSGMEIGHHQIERQDLSPQIQIQRLTAQLTAAYNRIAALEEQLLAKRWK